MYFLFMDNPLCLVSGYHVCMRDRSFTVACETQHCPYFQARMVLPQHLLIANSLLVCMRPGDNLTPMSVFQLAAASSSTDPMEVTTVGPASL